MGDKALEALVVVAGKVIDGETAERGADGTETVFVNKREVVGSIVDGSQIVSHALARPVARDLLVPLAAIARQSATVRGDDHIAVGSHDLEVPAVAPKL